MYYNIIDNEPTAQYCRNNYKILWFFIPCVRTRIAIINVELFWKFVVKLMKNLGTGIGFPRN